MKFFTYFYLLILTQVSQSIEFTEDAILMKLKVTTDDLNDPDVTCGTKKNLGGHEVVVATGAGPCLEGNVLRLKNLSYN